MEASPNEIVKNTINELKSQNIATGLEIGVERPNFEIKNQDNEFVTLFKLLKGGSVVLSFFRGDWCGYCNNE